MPRYYFHIRSTTVEIADDNGKPFACAWDAYFHARKLIIQASQYLDEACDHKERWAIRISNDEDPSQIIALFPLRRDTCRPPELRRSS